MASAIKAVFFDMGGTIEDLRSDREMQLQACRDLLPALDAQDFHLSLTPEELLETVTKGMAAYKEWALATMREANPEEIWAKWVLAGYLPQAKGVELGEFLAAYHETKFTRHTLRSDAPGTIKALKDEGLIVGVISNTQSRVQMLHNLSRYGLAEEVCPILLSSLAGIRKPHPSIFLAAACLAGVEPANALYVGDTFSRDIQGAFAAGFKGSILIRSSVTDRIDPDTLPEGIRRSFIPVSTLEEIPGLLDRFA